MVSGLLSGVLSALCVLTLLLPVNAQADEAIAEPVVAASEPEVSSVLSSGSAGEVAKGFFSGLDFKGYLRHYMSFNLHNVPETNGDDFGKMSMNRLTLLTQLSGPIGSANFTAIGRFSREQMTSYLNDLQDAARKTSSNVDFSSKYDENEIRELYLDIPVGERLKFRLGKQQVVWGETDFFQAMDVVHGYDQSWRAFLEPENEEWRKPLILANAQIAVPELQGSLQLLVRPGLDRARDIGNTYDMFGGRWAQNGSRGFDLNATTMPNGSARPADFVTGNIIPSLPFNYHHKDGNTDDAHYGGRWSGTLGPNKDFAYSLNYYHTQAQNPVLFTDPATAGNLGVSFIFPTIDIYGATLSGKVPLEFLDTVFRSEVAYVPDQPFNTLAMGGTALLKKDIIRSMFGLDTNLRLENILGTCNASMLSLQVFDTWITDFKARDAVKNAFGTKEKEHTTWLTGIFTLPYRSDTIKGQLVVVQDVSNGGGVIAPSIEFMMGPSWRVKLESDLFYADKKDDKGNNASLFGSYANNSQFLTRVTYQF
jgi:hypothetical protein